MVELVRNWCETKNLNISGNTGSFLRFLVWSKEWSITYILGKTQEELFFIFAHSWAMRVSPKSVPKKPLVCPCQFRTNFNLESWRIALSMLPGPHSTDGMLGRGNSRRRQVLSPYDFSNQNFWRSWAITLSLYVFQMRQNCWRWSYSISYRLGSDVGVVMTFEGLTMKAL